MRASVSADHSAVAVVVTVVTVATVRVATEDGMLVRARRAVVLLANSTLNCKFLLARPSFFLYDLILTLMDSRGGFGRGRGAPPS